MSNRMINLKKSISPLTENTTQLIRQTIFLNERTREYYNKAPARVNLQTSEYLTVEQKVKMFLASFQFVSARCIYSSECRFDS